MADNSSPIAKKVKSDCPNPHDLPVQDKERAEVNKYLHSQKLKGDIVLGNEMQDRKRPKKLGPILSSRFD